MILKINHSKEASKYHWFIMDNITRICVAEQKIDESGLKKYKNIDRIISDDKNAQSSPRNFIIAHCYTAAPHREFDEEYSLMFDTIGYLCSDDGQTLEKLVP